MCIASGCNDKVHGKGLCKKHYMRYFRHGDYSVGSRFVPPKTCFVTSCGKKPHTKGFCASHKYIYINGLTADIYDKMLCSQGYACRVCRRDFVKTPHIDHDHECCSGRQSCGRCVRGLLCQQCNMMLGLAKDSPEVLKSAVRYLYDSQITQEQQV